MNRSLKTPGDCQHPSSCLDHFFSCLMLGHYLSTGLSLPQQTNIVSSLKLLFLFFSFWMILKIKRQMQSWVMLNWSVHFGRSDSDQSDVLCMMGGKKPQNKKNNPMSNCSFSGLQNFGNGKTEITVLLHNNLNRSTVLRR